MRLFKFLFFCFPFGVFALTVPQNNLPFFDFSTSVPYAKNPIHYDVIFDGNAELVENTTKEITENETTQENSAPKVFSRETFSFSPKQKTLTKQAQKTVQNLTDKMKRNKKSRVIITLFFYKGSGFETAESKRLALKRSLSIKK